MSNEVINPEIIETRKELRKKILLEFYDENFKSGGEAKRMPSKISEDKEVTAAYRYLIDKGFLFAQDLKGVFLMVKISPFGIDFIEGGSEF